jgi:hypothetical protein
MLAKETTPLFLEQSRAQPGQDEHRFPRRHRRIAPGRELNIHSLQFRSLRRDKKILRVSRLHCISVRQAATAIFWQRLSKTCPSSSLSFVPAPGINHIAMVAGLNYLRLFAPT